VVVAIISLLSSVIFSSLKDARAKARDIKRQSDVLQIVKAFNLALDDNGGNFPLSGGSAVCLGTSGTCWDGSIFGSTTINALLQPYLPSIPVDPLRTSGKGDRYIYIDKNGHVVINCSSGNTYGPFIVWVTDKINPSINECKNSQMACCGTGGLVCSLGYFCVYKLQ